MSTVNHQKFLGSQPLANFTFVGKIHEILNKFLSFDSSFSNLFGGPGDLELITFGSEDNSMEFIDSLISAPPNLPHSPNLTLPPLHTCMF